MSTQIYKLVLPDTAIHALEKTVKATFSPLLYDHLRGEMIIFVEEQVEGWNGSQITDKMVKQLAKINKRSKTFVVASEFEKWIASFDKVQFQPSGLILFRHVVDKYLLAIATYATGIRNRTVKDTLDQIDTLSEASKSAQEKAVYAKVSKHVVKTMQVMPYHLQYVISGGPIFIKERMLHGIHKI